MKINAVTVKKIKAYCEFANIEKIDEFIEKAAEYVLSKDRDWTAHQDKEAITSLAFVVRDSKWRVLKKVHAFTHYD